MRGMRFCRVTFRALRYAKNRSEGFPLTLRGYSIPGRNGTWAWTPWEILLGASPPPPSPFGWLVGRLVGWQVGRLVGWLVGRLVGWLFGR